MQNEKNHKWRDDVSISVEKDSINRGICEERKERKHQKTKEREKDK